MRYYEITSVAAPAYSETPVTYIHEQSAEFEKAKRRYRQLNQERLRRIGIAVQLELQRYLDPDRLERIELSRILGK